MRAVKDLPWVITSVVCGMAKGADALGADYADCYSHPIHPFPADWKKFGRSAGYRRNEEMAKFGEACIVLWDGESRGSKHMIDLAVKYKLPTLVYKYNSNEYEFFNLEQIDETQIFEC